MSVLQRKELEDSPLADLHAIASELGIESYRAMVRNDLIAAILDAGPGGGDDGDSGEDSDEKPRRRRSRRSGRGRGASRSARSDSDEDADDDDADGDGDDAPAPRRSRGRGGRGRSRADDRDEDSDDDEPEGEPVAGILDIVSGGNGFVRVAEAAGDDDPYVSPAQIRRCELRAGDEVSGPVRPARRGERHPSLVRIDKVNGNDAEPPEQRPHFDELTAAHASERLPAPDQLSAIPYGKGSRVAIVGGPGAGATSLLREIAVKLAGADDVEVSVVLVGARPEELADWSAESSLTIGGGSFDESLDAQAQAAELAVQRGKRAAERGRDAVVVIDSIEHLQSGTARRVFGAARNVADGGSLTVIAAAGSGWEPLRQASVRIALDPPEAGAVKVAESRSQSLRADLLS